MRNKISSSSSSLADRRALCRIGFAWAIKKMSTLWLFQEVISH
jgi:hypothetical protein